jgi:MFS family permease
LTEPGTVTARRSSRLMWVILGLVLLADALDVIDATVTNIAAPTIASELNGGESLIKWLGPAYMLAMGVLLVVGIAARVAQGAFGALLIPQGLAIMTKAFSRDMLAKAFGLFGPVLGLSSVVASSLLAVTMLGLLYGLIEGSTNGWSVIPIVSITAGALFFAAFAYRQRTATHPLITPSLLSSFWPSPPSASRSSP